PREPGVDWPPSAQHMLTEWWQSRRERQREIDASIARHADTELLYDQPYEDTKRVRVTGPFTVESLSPHRVLAPEEERPASEAEAQRDDSANQFVLMVLDNLKKAGVQNTVAGQRLTFDRLEPVTGTWIQARGEYTDASGNARRVAISVGPQYGTVGATQVQEAALEATRGIGCDVVILCGFAFDAMAGEKAKELSPEVLGREGFVAEQKLSYGKVQVLLAKMNPDLSMGDALLKKTGAGNLFMVFGEPDVHIGTQADGRVTVHIRGLDIYDPTTGEIRSSSTSDIACWFLDTNYDGKSFFVRHAYFTGGDDPYDKLKRTLRAEIDEAAWSALYSAESVPFDAPTTGKIAVKVINHYGDEVLKVYGV
ncbi:MAG: site-specific DNA-methyltransferase, partial [Ktedonobacterales bacterium]